MCNESNAMCYTYGPHCHHNTMTRYSDNNCLRVVTVTAEQKEALRGLSLVCDYYLRQCV